jgi:hypothetical protein
MAQRTKRDLAAVADFVLSSARINAVDTITENGGKGAHEYFDLHPSYYVLLQDSAKMILDDLSGERGCLSYDIAPLTEKQHAAVSKLVFADSDMRVKS